MYVSDETIVMMVAVQSRKIVLIIYLIITANEIINCPTITVIYSANGYYWTVITIING